LLCTGFQCRIFASRAHSYSFSSILFVTTVRILRGVYDTILRDKANDVNLNLCALVSTFGPQGVGVSPGVPKT
jgi:hypothetical protein